MRRRHFLAAAAAATAGRSGAQPALARVAAASDLQFALPVLAERFERAGPHRVLLSFGSSGQFATQIRQGAPYELFMSADEGFALGLVDAGLARDAGALYALGRIALLAPTASTLVLDERLDGLRLAWPQLRRFAIANPEHAPYGRAAREALQKLGLWTQVQPRLALGENVSQATQFVSSGAADAGIVALSLALAPPVAALTRHLPLPTALHAPLRQRMVLLKSAGSAAQAFYDFLATPAARGLLADRGFATPGGVF